MAPKTPKDEDVKLHLPEAAAVWLIDNTTLTYPQIAGFTGLYLIDVESIADGHMAAGVKGRNPVEFREMTAQDLERAIADPTYIPARATEARPVVPTRMKGPRYTPLSKRGDKPDAIAWLVKHHPHMRDAHIIKLIGTTKTTIAAIRNKTHANMSNITARNPADLGLCSWADLEAAIARAEADRPKEDDTGQGEAGGAAEKGDAAGFDFAHFMPVRQGTQT
jgi:uncharacterized protein